MIITLSPQARASRADVVRQGEALVIDGAVFDFSSVQEGETLHVDSEWVVGPVTRVDGVLRLTLLLGHGQNAPVETRWPMPVVDPPDGPIPFPPFDQSVPEEGEEVAETQTEA